MLQNIENSRRNGKLQIKLIDDSADKCRNKLPSTDTKFKCEVRKTTALPFQNNKNNNNKLKIIKKKSTYNFRGNN